MARGRPEYAEYGEAADGRPVRKHHAQFGPRASRGADGKDDVDPFAPARRPDYPPTQTPVDAGDAHAGDVKEKDNIVRPAVIGARAHGSYTRYADGKTFDLYHALPGWEHLLAFPDQVAGGVPHPPNRPTTDPGRNDVQAPALNPTYDQKPKLRKTPPRRLPAQKPQNAKRKRSVIEQAPLRSQQQCNDDDDDDDDDNVHHGRASWAQTTETHSFHIGDIDKLKQYYEVRLMELTMKPVRPIVTEWLKLLAPDRITRFGRYHKKYPNEAEPGSHPPWWPENVKYNEPSHLNKRHLIPLAVDLMLIHRRKDEEAGKTRAGWIAKLKTVADYQVLMHTANHLSSAKNEEYSRFMKERAMVILADLFDAAQAHEDYLAQYDLYEGTGNVDPKRGKHHSWSRAAKPPRKTQRKRTLKNTPAEPPPPRSLPSDESGDETEVDENDCEEEWTMVSSENASFQMVDASEDGGTSRQSCHSPIHHLQPLPVGNCMPVVTSAPASMPGPQIYSPPTTAPSSAFAHSVEALPLNEPHSMDTKRYDFAIPQPPQMHASYNSYGLQPMDGVIHSFPPAQEPYSSVFNQGGWWMPPPEQMGPFGDSYPQQPQVEPAYPFPPNPCFSQCSNVPEQRYLPQGPPPVTMLPPQEQHPTHGLPY